ncbi:MAG: polyprenyl synthetase family protein [Candidatus Cloacimonetes bacterium]|nr:polyprenyl synthetase family protein [Candidatus Cloacimonadota bacterium]
MQKLLSKLKYEHFDYLNESTHALTTLYGILCPKDNQELHNDIAKSLELIKSSTLIIDDILDKSPQRNGITSLYREIGIESSILVAEILKSQAVLNITKIVSTISPQYLQRIIILLEDTYSTICQGQLEDIEYENIPIQEVTLEKFFNMIEQTSAHFVALPAIIASILSNRKEDEIARITRFGIYIGIAYQIRDDILDIVSDQEYSGKAELVDIKSNKKRLPIIITYENCNEKEKKQIEQIFNSTNEIDQTKIDLLLKLIKNKNSISKCCDLLSKFKSMALEEIDNWYIKKQLEQLTSFSELLTNFQSLSSDVKKEFGVSN